MKILAIELSSGRGSIAWQNEAGEPTEVAFANDRRHSGLFFENLQQTLERFGQPELIVVGLGPGSYAGARIAIATATGLSAATGAQLIGLSSLQAFNSDSEEYCVVGDARRHSFFFARVVRRACIEGPLLCTVEELTARMDANGSPVFASEHVSAAPGAVLAYPSAGVLASVAVETPPTSAATPLEPMYLREPHITQPKAAATSKVSDEHN